MIAWLAVAIIGTAALTVAMRREHKRLDREAAMRRLVEPIKQDWIRFQAQVDARLLPAFQQMTADLQRMLPAAEKAAKAFTDALNRERP